MKKVIFAFLLLPLSGHSAIKVFDVSWTAPTQYTDNSALDRSDITHFFINMIMPNSQEREYRVDGALNETKIRALALAGQYEFTMRVCIENSCSDPTSAVTRTLQANEILDQPTNGSID